MSGSYRSRERRCGARAARRARWLAPACALGLAVPALAVIHGTPGRRPHRATHAAVEAVASLEAVGVDGERPLRPAGRRETASRSRGRPARSCRPQVPAPSVALVEHHLRAAGRDSCSGTTLPPPHRPRAVLPRA